MSANGKFRMGLNVRKSVETAVGPKKTANIFGDESDDDEQQNAAEKFERKYAASAGTKAREQRIVEKELAKNPDIFDYDTHYEEIQQQRDQKVATQKEADKEKKPKYAHLLAKAHKQRELSKLLVEENTYKKEREKEAGQFEDEEVFVTGAYRQQIEERERHKTEMEREEALEKMRDVRDQKMWQQAFNRTMLENISRGPLTEEGKMEEEDGGAEEKRIKTEAKTEKMTKMEVKEEAMEEEKGRTEEEERHGEEGRDERKRQEGEKEKKTDGKRQRRQPTPPAEEAGKGGEEVQQRTEEERHRRRRERTEEKEERETGRTTDEGRKRARKGDESGGSREKAEQKQDEEAQRMARIRQVLAKRNDENAIEEAKQRYLERRRGGLIVAPRIQAAE